MPVMKVCNDDGTLNFLAPYMVQAVMCHPRDDDKRMQLYTVQTVGSILKIENYRELVGDNEKLLSFIIESLETLNYAPTPDDVRQEANRSVSGASIVSFIVQWLLSASEYHHELKISVSRMIDTLSQLPKQLRGFQEEQIPMGKSLLWKNWGKFKPVAHLFAAAGECTADTGEVYERNPLFGLPDQLSEFLSVAERIREECERLRILDPQETWRPPGHFVREDTELEIHPLADDLREALENSMG